MERKKYIEKVSKKSGSLDKIKAALQSIADLFHAQAVSAATVRKPENKIPARLPESVTYDLKYREAKLGHDEIQSMLREDFKGAGLYLALKATDSQPDLQAEILSSLIENIVGGKDYAGIYDNLMDIVNRRKISAKVDGSKVAQIYRQGFDLFENKFRKIAKEVKAEQSVPVLLTYAATLGLKPFLENMPAGGYLVLFNAKKLDANKTADCGFIIKRTEKHFDLAPLNPLFSLSGMFGDSPVVLIDDTKRSGESLAHAKKLFDEQSDWPKITGEKFIAFPGDAIKDKE